MIYRQKTLVNQAFTQEGAPKIMRFYYFFAKVLLFGFSLTPTQRREA